MSLLFFGRKHRRLPLLEVNVGLLANQVGEAATATLDGSEGVHDLTLAVNVGVHHTQDVRELVLVQDQSLYNHLSKI